jgi:predicted ester cyclase
MIEPNRCALGMRGFDSEFTDLSHYIRVITDRIWEGRRINDIERYYSDPCVVETPLGVSTSIQDVIMGTQATLHMFPNRRLLAEDIIISGDDDHGYLSSHRIISPMTHQGDGNFGTATGKQVRARTIADCVCKDNRIIHEWLVRDHAAIALSIGTTPKALATLWLGERKGWHKPMAPAAPASYQSDISGNVHQTLKASTNQEANTTVANNHALNFATRYAANLERLASNRAKAVNFTALYDEAVHQIIPGEAHQYGKVAAHDYWYSLFSAFKVEQFSIEHLVENSSSQRGRRVALRWRAMARHQAAGESGQQFGVATARLVEIMGINHIEIVDDLVLREWVLIDEVALWMQIL